MINKKELLNKFESNLILSLIDRFKKGHVEKVILIKTLLMNEAYEELGEVAHQFKNQFGYLCSHDNFEYFQSMETFQTNLPAESYDAISTEIDHRIEVFLAELKAIEKELGKGRESERSALQQILHREQGEKGDRKSILIAEDDKISQMVLKMMLKGEFHLYLASTGTEALEIYVSEHPDLVLMDINMPEINGYEVMKRISQQSVHRAPVLAVTALFLAEERENLKNAGFDDVVVKPYNENDIREAIFKYLPR
ncbi:MAG: response regulator [Spirochaetales bacterium]|nr:response regulator [Spirochaetales bacterium]